MISLVTVATGSPLLYIIRSSSKRKVEPQPSPHKMSAVPLVRSTSWCLSTSSDSDSDSDYIDGSQTPCDYGSQIPDSAYSQPVDWTYVKDALDKGSSLAMDAPHAGTGSACSTPTQTAIALPTVNLICAPHRTRPLISHNSLFSICSDEEYDATQPPVSSQASTLTRLEMSSCRSSDGASVRGSTFPQPLSRMASSSSFVREETPPPVLLAEAVRLHTERKTLASQASLLDALEEEEEQERASIPLKLRSNYYISDWKTASHNANSYCLDEDGEEVFAPESQEYDYVESSQGSIHSYDDLAFRAY